MPSAISFNLDQPKILSSGNGLRDQLISSIQHAHQDYFYLPVEAKGYSFCAVRPSVFHQVKLK